MITNIPNRIKTARKSLNLTQEELAESLGVSLSMVGGIEAKKQKMSLDFAEKMEEVHGVRAAWITYGSGMMMIKEQEIFDRNASLNRQSSEILKNFAGSVIGRTAEIRFYPDIAASAGYGCLNGDHCEHEVIRVDTKLLPMARSFERIEAIRAHGDSMEPTIRNGDMIFVDKSQREILNGKIYVVRMGDEVYVKRIFFGINDIIVKSDNPTHPQFNIKKDQVDVLGQVIYTMEYHG